MSQQLPLHSSQPGLIRIWKLDCGGEILLPCPDLGPPTILFVKSQQEPLHSVHPGFIFIWVVIMGPPGPFICLLTENWQQCTQKMHMADEHVHCRDQTSLMYT